MQAVTIRKQTDNSLVAFGPDNGMYDPGTPVGCVRAIEANYDTVFAEWKVFLAAQPPVVDPVQTKIDAALVSPLVPQVIKDILTALRPQV